MDAGDVAAVVDLIVDRLDDSTPLARAQLLDAVSHAVYDHVVRSAPEGGGFDGRDGPERWALGKIVDTTAEYLDELRAAAVRDEHR